MLAGFKHWQLKADDQFRIETKDARFHREPRLPLYLGRFVAKSLPHDFSQP